MRPTADDRGEVTLTFDVHQLDSFLLVGVRGHARWRSSPCGVSSAPGSPACCSTSLMGVLLGESGLGIEFEDAELAHALGFGALAVILAEGGLTTNWREMRPSMRLGVTLATVGVAVSVAVVAVGAHFLLGLPWELASCSAR